MSEACKLIPGTSTLGGLGAATTKPTLTLGGTGTGTGLSLGGL